MTDEMVIGFISDILGLSSIETRPERHTEHKRAGRNGWTAWEGYVPSTGIKPLFPSAPAVLSLEIENQLLLSPDPALLIMDPARIRQTEVAFVTEGGLKWMRIIRLGALPPRYVSKIDGLPFEIHYRASWGGRKEYSNGIFVWNGKIASAAYRDLKQLREDRDCKEMAFNFVGSLSAIENLVALWTCRVQFGEKAIVVGSDEDSIKELADMRQEPTDEKGRRKAILHWVTRHLRRTKKKTSAVSAHLRGIEQINLGEWRIDLVPPLPLLKDYARPERFDGSLTYEVLTCLA